MMDYIFKKPITVVCGFPRSGTTLMMLMLEKAGIPIVSDTDGGTEARFTYARGNLNPDKVGSCQGCAVKILDPHVNILPAGYFYRFLFMERNPVEQAKSRLKLLKTLGAPVVIDTGTIRKMADSITCDTPDALRLLKSYPESDVLRVRFENLLARPVDEAGRVLAFLNHPGNPNVMAAMVKPREAACAPDMSIELETIKQKRNDN